MEAILANGLSWLTKHVPALASLVFLIIAVIWITVIISDFNHRVAETERTCNDINTRQLPEIRTQITEIKTDIKEMKTEIKEMKTEIKEMKTEITEIKRDITEMKEEIGDIKLFVKKIDTYLSTKDKDYPK